MLQYPGWWGLPPPRQHQHSILRRFGRSRVCTPCAHCRGCSRRAPPPGISTLLCAERCTLWLRAERAHLEGPPPGTNTVPSAVSPDHSRTCRAKQCHSCTWRGTRCRTTLDGCVWHAQAGHVLPKRDAGQGKVAGITVPGVAVTHACSGRCEGEAMAVERTGSVASVAMCAGLLLFPFMHAAAAHVTGGDCRGCCCHAGS